MSRRSISVLVGMVVVLSAAYGGWSWGVPKYRPGLHSGEVYGLDVSHHQGAVDWESVAGDDVDFVYLKATEGGDFVDPMFGKNYREAQAAGLRIGAYHFFTFCTPGDIQAKHFLATVDEARGEGYQAELPLALDLEFGGNCSEENRLDDVDEEVARFLTQVESATQRPTLIYQLEGFEGDTALPSLDEGGPRPRWERKLFRRPSQDWVVWQFHYRGDVDGVDGPVDINVGSPDL